MNNKATRSYHNDIQTQRGNMSERKTFKLSDQIIGQIRELIQLSLLTRTHIVDNFRMIELEESEQHPGKLIFSEKYCNGWNEMVEKMHADAEAKHEKQTTTLAEDDGNSEQQLEEKPTNLN